MVVYIHIQYVIYTFACKIVPNKCVIESYSVQELILPLVCHWFRVSCLVFPILFSNCPLSVSSCVTCVHSSDLFRL